jgi:tripartite-type tricarboxylate transporter receptor subunit TctC
LFKRCALPALLSGFAALAGAQSPSTPLPVGYPNKSLPLLVGNAPCGGIDITARVVVQKMGKNGDVPSSLTIVPVPAA